MKLKLENHPKAKILRASEEVRLEHVDVLKAGLQKLLQSDPKTIILDLTGCKVASNEVLFRLGSLHHLCGDAGGSFVLAGHAEAMYKTPQEATEKLDKGGIPKALLQLYAKDYLLRADEAQLEREKAALEGKLKTLEGASNQAGDIHKEISLLKRTKKLLEMQLKDLVVNLPGKKPSLEKDAQASAIQKAVDVILQKSGY